MIFTPASLPRHKTKRGNGGNWHNFHTCPWTGRGKGKYYGCGVFEADDGGLIATCRHQPDKASRDLLEALNVEPGRVLAAVPVKAADERPKAGDNLLNAVYLDVLDRQAILTDAHRAALRGRGMAPAEWIARGYKTNDPHIKRPRIEGAGTVPGFLRGRWSAHNHAGLLVPVRNAAGLVVGIRVRLDDPGDGGRYRWLTGSTATVHHALPLDRAPVDRRVWVTEGEIKADMAAQRLSALVLSVPGVGLWQSAGLLDCLPAGAAVVLAYDVDAYANPDVARHTLAAARAIEAAGHPLTLATWDTAHKGLDDALVAGVDLRHLTVAEWLETLPADVREKADPGPCRRVIWAYPVEPYRDKEAIDLVLIREQMAAELRQVMASNDAGLHVFMQGTGAGKTTETIKAAIELVRTDPRARVLFLAQSHEKIRELLTDSNLPELAAMVSGGEALHLWGKMSRADARKREADHSLPAGSLDAFVCDYPDERATVAEGRHDPTTVCDECPLGYNAPGGATCPALKVADAARRPRGVVHRDPTKVHPPDGPGLVLTTYGSALGAGNLAGAFQVLIVDEALAPHLTERVTVTGESIGLWLARMAEIDQDRANPYGEAHPLRRFLRHLQELMERAGTLGDHGALPITRELARSEGWEGLLDEALAAPFSVMDPTATDRELRRMEWDQAHRRYWFERPDGRRPIQRAVRELLEAIADSRCGDLRLTRAGLVLRVVRPNVRGREGITVTRGDKETTIGNIDSVYARTVVNLDATPDLGLLRVIFPDLTTHGADAGLNVRITQVVGGPALGPGSGGDRKERLWDWAEDRLRAAGVTAGILGTRRKADTDTEGDPNLTTLGSDSRGSNRWAKGYGAVIYADDYTPNITDLDQAACALRGVRPVPVPDEPDRRLVPFEVVGADRVPAVERTCHPDPFVQARIDHERTAHVLQTIGRVRPLTKREPVPVILLPSRPYVGLPIHEWVTADEAAPKRQAMNLDQVNETRREAAKVTRESIEQAKAGGARTHAEIADALGVTRRAVSKVIARIKSESGLEVHAPEGTTEPNSKYMGSAVPSLPCASDPVGTEKTETDDLVAKVRQAVEAIPDEPFQLSPAVKVVNPALFKASLLRDAQQGPKGPRAKSGALQEDVSNVQRIGRLFAGGARFVRVANPIEGLPATGTRFHHRDTDDEGGPLL